MLLACAQPASAVARKQATRTAMKALHVRAETGSVAPHRRAWLFWFDQPLVNGRMLPWLTSTYRRRQRRRQHRGTATIDVPPPDSTHVKSRDCSAPPAPA